uniref:Uncharacterized protein n=1 Tax=Euplotes crassus TaxID=5936 RepID=A0A7S3NY10_EUPCR|mmetsp:Transcript_29212/g.28836  ORF Transcript_29212/g.28836 Transcript_29212/m.28836 type:complete len:211 (+) Transcript_29212:950-1582(+)
MEVNILACIYRDIDIRSCRRSSQRQINRASIGTVLMKIIPSKETINVDQDSQSDIDSSYGFQRLNTMKSNSVSLSNIELLILYYIVNLILNKFMKNNTIYKICRNKSEMSNLFRANLYKFISFIQFSLGDPSNLQSSHKMALKSINIFAKLDFQLAADEVSGFITDKLKLPVSSDPAVSDPASLLTPERKPAPRTNPIKFVKDQYLKIVM